MTRALERRLGALERQMRLDGGTVGPCFVMARTTADREIARIKAEFGDRLPHCLFVMTLAGRERSGQ
jgi:hypothetical protein